MHIIAPMLLLLILMLLLLLMMVAFTTTVCVLSSLLSLFDSNQKFMTIKWRWCQTVNTSVCLCLSVCCVYFIVVSRSFRDIVVFPFSMPLWNDNKNSVNLLKTCIVCVCVCVRRTRVLRFLNLFYITSSAHN